MINGNLPSQKPRLSNFDYLRGISAFGIMIYHYVSWGTDAPPGSTFLGKVGVYGVSIFYILSGLTLFYVYYDKMKFRWSDLSAFYLKRFFRIFPLLWLALGLTFLIQRHVPPLGPLLLNLTGLFSVVDPHAYFAAGVWSIGNELTFYLVFPLLVFSAANGKRSIYAISLLALAIYLFFAFFILHPNTRHFQDWNSYINPLNQLFLFVAGFLLGLNFRHRTFHPVLPYLLIAGGIVVFATFYYNVNLAAGLNRIVFTMASLSICLGFYKMPFGLPRVAHFIFSKLGEASYSVYLLHPVVGFALRKGAAGFSLNPDTFTLNAVSVVTTLIVSYIVYLKFERPFMKFGDHLIMLKKYTF